MRTLASHLTVFLVAVILATAAGAMAQSPKPASLASRIKRLELRHDLLQSRYQTFCNTLKRANTKEIDDPPVRRLFNRLAETCWGP
jgi:hypothetical protein